MLFKDVLNLGFLLYHLFHSQYFNSNTAFGCGFMVFHATFNNIYVVSWRSVLLVEDTRENHWPTTSHGQTLSRNVV